MSVQTQNTNLNPYSNTPIKNLEYIQNKALVIAPTEITKNGLLDTDLMLDTAGFITMYLYKKIVTGEVKEPTANQFKLIKTISDLDSIGINSEALITTFDIPVIFKYNKDTGTRTIEKGTSGIQLPSDYIDFTIDETNASFSLEGFFCVCKVQKIQKELTTPFSDVANDEFLFMIPSEECRELIEPVEFDSSSLDNKVINIKKYGIPLSNDTKQGYRIYPILKISDHITLEDTFSAKYYLGTKYQRNIMEILSHSIKSKRIISNLKDMYLVDNQCIQSLNKINVLLANDQMIKFTERLYNLGTPLREKLNADVILEYLSAPVSGSSDNDLAATLKASLMEDYNFTQEEIDNLNDNLSMFKSRTRIALATPTIDNDKFRFNLPKTFIDGNRSRTEKKNLLVFGTNAGFNKFNLTGYTAPYSNISKRGQTDVLDTGDLTLGLPVLERANDSKIKMVSCARMNTIILYNNGDLFIKGHNGDGQLNFGYRDSTSSVNFRLIGSEITHATVSERYVTIVKNNRIYGLGYDSGQSGNGNRSGFRYSWYLSSFNPNNQIIKIDSNDESIAVLLDNGDLYFCGENSNYSAGLNHNSDLFYFTKIATNVKDFTLGTHGTFYISDNNDLYYSGLYSYGLAGTGVKSYGVDSTKCYKVFTKVATNVKKVITHNAYPSYMANICSFYISTNDDLYFTGVSTPNIYPETLFWTKKASDVKDVIRGDGNIGILYNNGDLYLAGNNSKGVFGNFNPGNNTTFYKIDTKVEALADKMNCDYSSSKFAVISYIKDKKLVSSGTHPDLFSGVKSNFIESPQLGISDSFKDILTNYKQQIPFTYIPLSTDIKDINDKPVFENLDNITGFEPTDIVIDIPNVL